MTKIESEIMEVPRSDLQQLCKEIRNMIDRQEELQHLLDPLHHLTCGAVDEIKNPVFNILSSEELILSVLKVNKCVEILKNKIELCIKAVNSLLFLSRRKDWAVIILLTKIILQSDFEDKNIFLQDIWNKKELHVVSTELVLILVNHEPALIEKEICDIYLTAKEHKYEWPNHFWICWCSQSSQLFIIVTSILNQFVIEAKDKSAILKIVCDFISHVKIECENKDSCFFSLYPLEYHSFVASLIIEPNINPCTKEIIKKFKVMKNANITLMLLFLSHFPVWMDLAM